MIRSGLTLTRARPAAVVERFGLVFVLIAVVVGFSIALPSIYPTSTNLKIILSGQAIVLLLALAVTLPLRAGEFDLSIGAVAVTAATMVGVLTTNHHVPLGLAIAAAIGIGIVVGLVNAFVVVGIGINAFIATLGSMTLVSGIGYAISSDGQVIGSVPQGLVNLSSDEFLSLPVRVWMGWGLALVLWYVYEFTAYGRRLLFVGGNPAAARLTGIRVSREKASAFVLSATLSAATGVLLAGSLGSVDPTTAGDYLLQPYAAAFLGTTVLQFGRFNSLGTVIGLYLLAAGVSGLELLGVQTWVNDVFNGATLILAVAAATLMRRGMRRLAVRKSEAEIDAEMAEHADKQALDPEVLSHG